MRQRSVFLVRSASCNWTGLRATLDTMPRVAIVGDTARAADAREHVPILRPDVVISAIDVEDVPCVPLLQDLRMRLPSSSFVVFAGRYAIDELVALADIHVTGYFLWDDLESPAFPGALDAALSGTFAVTGKSVAIALLNHHNGVGRAARGDIVLIEREGLVMARLAQGLIRDQIAEVEHVSRRTVDRTIGRLFDKFGVGSSIELICAATRRGFLE